MCRSRLTSVSKIQVWSGVARIPSLSAVCDDCMRAPLNYVFQLDRAYAL